MKIPIRKAIALPALCMLALCLPVPAREAVNPAPSAIADSKKLQGKWEGVEVGHESEGKCTLTIKNDTIHFQGSNKQEWYKTTFTLVPGTEPKQLRATITECPQPEYVGKVGLSIYKLEGETLTLTGNEPGVTEVPKNFGGDKDSRTFIFKKPQPRKEKADPSEPK